MMPSNLEPASNIRHSEEFVGLLSTQTRSAMHTILGMLQLMSDSHLNDAQESYVQTCRMTADNLLRTADDISGAAWQPELSAEAQTVLDLRGFLAKVEDVFRLTAEANGRQFHWMMQPDVPERVLVNELLVERFLIRLIGRALEAGGPAVAVNIESSTTHVQNEAMAIVTVRLSGTSEENAASSLEDVLGFAITRKMAGWLDAEVVTEEAGDGTWQVECRIPMQLAPGSPAESMNETVIESDPTHHSKTVGATRVLVADDSDDAYLLVETYLKGQNCTLVRARDGLEAVRLGLSDNFDLILMDIDMPNCTGYEATQRIRSDETLRGSRRVPIVVLSADSLQNQLHIGGRVGCSGYLTKPVKRAALVRVLERYQAAG